MKSRFTNVLVLIGTAIAVGFSASSTAATLALQDIPLFLPAAVPPLNMLTIGRDHKLYYEAYNDYSDLNGDGVLDIRYKPAEIDYYGYFDSFKCYTYNSGSSRFEPAAAAGANKTCSGQWSGDFLNYLTTSRIDALRKVLYGGSRSSDGSSAGSDTVLERSRIPQDAHSWGKEYTSTAVDGYDISQYTPLSQPTAGTRHLFANTTPLNTSLPLLRYLTNRSERIWNWVSIERPVAGTDILTLSGSRTSVTPNDVVVRVKVCVAGMLESNCQRYSNGNYKPVGLLQEFGENNSMYFGLITGSYLKNTSGGVLRRKIGSIQDEVDLTNGTFKSYDGIIRSLNRLRTTGFGGSYEYSCGWASANSVITEGQCQMWGNPVAEMMYEGLRYFAGKGSPTSAFSISFGAGEESQLSGGGLPVATWDNPYTNRPVCSKPFQTVVSDINPSYDTDQLPGSAFGSFSGDLTGLNVSSLGQTIWNSEFGAAQKVFIGESNGVADGAPTAKEVSSFGNIRGLSPEEPTKNGGYYAASVAYYGKTTDLNPASGDQKVSTFSVALASPLPKINIPVNGKTITLVPFAKSVAGAGINLAGTFQPTDQIVDFYVDTLTPTYGRFRVNFEDVEQGADHDMDAIVVYEYTVNGSTVDIKLTSEYAAGGITQHMGYVISGTTKDGIYLEVLDQRTGDPNPDPDYRLDTPPTFTGTPPAPSSGSGTWDDDVPLPFVATRTFSPGTSPGASLLKDPLWYSAKWGGFDESFRAAADQNNIPDSPQEWDEDGNGTPDNYFLVTNALELSKQLRSAFEDILKKTTSSASASVNSGSISSDTRIYQARFNTGEWTGELLSYRLDPASGKLITPAEWDASSLIPAAASRRIITANSNRTPVAFQWASLDSTRQMQLGSQSILNYVRGDTSNEGTGPSNFRQRNKKLGDIVSSAPLYVGKPGFRYPDGLESVAYSTFVSANSTRQGTVFVGANDGMLHAFDATSGAEVFGFVPSPVFSRLPALTAQSYSHQYYVDGSPSVADVFYGGGWHTVLTGGLNKGGQGIYALDVTTRAAMVAAETDPSSMLLWEFTDSDDAAKPGIQGDADLGLTFSQPLIVKLHSGRWAAIFGNGYNNTMADGSASTTGNAVLYVVDVQTGDLVRKIDTGVGMTADPTGASRANGLATPAVVDIDRDRIYDYVYAGDLFGNMWKFDLRSTTAGSWDVAYKSGSTNLPLFQARDSSNNAQPITVRPEVGRGPGGVGTIVLFGTGKYMEPEDKLLPPSGPTRPQTFYGIVDKNTGASSDVVTSRSALTQQSIITETSIDPDGSGPLGNINVRISTDLDSTGTRGWYIDLVSPSGYQGEKAVSNPIVRDSKVIFTTLLPDSNPCAFGGGSWLMELDMLTGARLKYTPFDINNDGKFDDSDAVTITLPDGTTQVVFISGVGSTEGILQSPGVINGETGSSEPLQYKYMPGSSGNIQQVIENPGPGRYGRQSWRQLR